MNDMARELIAAAVKAAANAYAPYSRFHVGAALLTRDGDIVTGCNVENASYGLTICAERNALFAAIAMNRRKFRAVAVVADGKVMPYPCGACRQVLHEFCGPGVPFYLATIGNPGRIKSLTMEELLPHAFSFKE